MGALLNGGKKGEPVGAKGGPRGGGGLLGEALSARLAEAAEAQRAGDKPLYASKMQAAGELIKSEAAADPQLADRLIASLGDRLSSMSESDYEGLFRSGDGRGALARTRVALRVAIKHASARLLKAIEETRAAIMGKLSRGETLAPEEAALEHAAITPADFDSMATSLGPREASMLLDAAEEAAGSDAATRGRRLSRFLEILCGLRIRCPSLVSSLGGACPL
jgi:hypothetical protein